MNQSTLQSTSNDKSNPASDGKSLSFVVFSDMLLQKFGITAEEGGFGPEQLVGFASEDACSEYYGKKFDLTRIDNSPQR